MAQQARTLTSPCPPSGEPGTLLVETERLAIRRYLASDAPALVAAANHAAIAARLRDRFPSPYTPADAAAFLGRHSTAVASRYPVHGALLLKPRTEGNPSALPLLVGALGVVPGDDVHWRTWELGFWLTPSAWGRGYMTEAVYAFTRWIFATWPGLVRIEATTFGGNAQSAHVLRKCGFVEEGTRRAAVEKNGQVMDHVMLGLTRSDVETGLVDAPVPPKQQDAPA